MTSLRTMITSVLFILFALGGAWFAGVSTYDFFLHLDGQVHSITCSYVPGTAERDELGTSGCYAVMMSPYSSVMRDRTWAGIPIALPGLAVFIYMIFIGLEHLLLGRHRKRADAVYLVAASLLPLVTSIAYYYISVTKVGEVCKMCVGIYVMSIGLFLAAVAQLILARREQEPGPHHIRNTILRYLLWFVEGVLFVVIPVIMYMNLKPEYQERNCGELVKPEDRSSIMLPAVGQGVPAIEVLDPLCPSCEVFRNRLADTEVFGRLSMKTVLFPLDSECNWMLKEPVHHGACLVSRAILCSTDPEKVIDWALENNVEIRKAAKEKGQDAVKAMVLEKFGDVSQCIDTAETKQKLNLSLRWIMANSLPLLTPQLYVNNRRLCDEDMDLGLEYGLGRLIEAGSTTEGGK
ncbi:MAG TPA: vitamin K epoxide reductase family protein [Myxococcota bacterium]|nr:vitamin K epoxide reductase family protein [Myxococcota bacterium]HOA13443.1 vitamin K epoxide reductase family protein [Myxococcota bacterium]